MRQDLTDRVGTGVGDKCAGVVEVTVPIRGIAAVNHRHRIRVGVGEVTGEQLLVERRPGVVLVAHVAAAVSRTGSTVEPVQATDLRNTETSLRLDLAVRQTQQRLHHTAMTLRGLSHRAALTGGRHRRRTQHRLVPALHREDRREGSRPSLGMPAATPHELIHSTRASHSRRP